MVANHPFSRASVGTTVAVAAVATVGAAALWLWAERVDRRASGSWLGRNASATAHTRTSTGAGTDTDTNAGPHNGTSTSSGTSPSVYANTRSAPTARSASPQHPTDASHSDAVVVLGYRNRGERANLVNRFRVRAGIRSLDTTAETSTLILCGGAVGSATPEAHLMQRYARERLGFTGTIVLDDTSRSTWQNIANAIPHLERADTIKIISNAPHGQMGREILWRQRPDLAQRLIRGAEHRFGEAPLLKVLSALRAEQSKISGAWARSSDPLTTASRQPRP